MKAHALQSHKVIYLMWLVLTIVLLFVSRGSLRAAPATFTVTNTNDSGAGSLRQAITDANSNSNPTDTDIISFNIPGTGVHTIAVSSNLPAIYEPVDLNGYSQSGSSSNTAVAPNPLNGTINIELKGGVSIDIGLNFNTGSSGSIVKGLSLYDFNSQQIYIDTGNITVQGNYIGVKADGFTRGDNLTGAEMEGIKVNSGTGSKIGGINTADRNVVTGPATGANINSNSDVMGNFIGLARDGVTDLGTNISLAASGSGAHIGGSTLAQRNVMSGGTTSCVLVLGNNNVVQGNYIGTDYTGSKNNAISNGLGVNLSVNSSENLIGGTNAGERNLIKGVQGSGVVLAQITVNAYGPLELIPSKNSILGNSISNIDTFNYPNFGNSNLGIDAFRGVDTDNPADFKPNYFEQQGVTPNDSGDADTGPNNYINFPVLKSAQQIGNQLTINYDLDATDSPTNRYRVEFFANDTSTIFGQGPGETYLGADNSVSPGTDKTITLTVSGDYVNKSLSATTTAIDSGTSSGYGATSEFAKNISIGSATDFDSDGIADATENLGPNNGDGNNDGTPDRLQPTVTTFEIDSSGIYATLVTDGCSENGTVASVDLSSLNHTDNGYDYPFGLTDFTLNCSRGDTVNVSLYIHTQTNPQKYIPRKYNSVSGIFRDLPGAMLTNVTVSSSSTLKLNYSIQDGGEYDDDGTANGIIVDPVGLATVASSTTTDLANTGTNIYSIMMLAGILIITGGGIVRWSTKR